MVRPLLNSETNRVMAWAIASVYEKQSDKTTTKAQLLALMMCKEKDVDEEYLNNNNRCDLTFMIRNCGGEGGLNIVTERFSLYAICIRIERVLNVLYLLYSLFLLHNRCKYTRCE